MTGRVPPPASGGGGTRRARAGAGPALAGLLAALAVAAPAAAAPTLRPAGAGGPYGNELLSNETTLSRWAHSYWEARIRSRPSRSAHTKGRLRLATEDGVQEVYLVLRSKVGAGGRVWFQIRMLGRPNGRTGWVEEEALSPLNVVRTELRISTKTLRAALYRRGRKIWSAPVGVGKASTPTPKGHFWIREALGSLSAFYGPWAFGTSAYTNLSDWPGGGVVGIHGTSLPALIPGRPSHGCVRLWNNKIVQLKRLLPIGTPVLIT